MFKSDYGHAIAEWIVKITTYISKDKALGLNPVNPFSLTRFIPHLKEI
jgi:hypothetical protein